MYKTLIFFAIFFLSHSKLLAQNKFPSYHAPLDIPLILSANFGELRPNHFHMGLDFKTNGKIGFNIYAIEDGYVSRIKISSFGYGKVIYIDHPDGKTSVYAHCDKMKGELDSVVRKAQYTQERFDVELFPKPNEVNVKKGDVIAISGNTGGSSGPHLHFEIRETKTEIGLNPLVYGYDIPDSISPQIRKIKVFGLNKDGFMIPDMQQETIVKGAKDSLYVLNDTLVVPAFFATPTGGIGFALDAIDILNGAANQCGLYGSYLIVDGDTVFGQRIDKIGFDETRFVNSHRDMSAMGSKYHKAYRNIANLLKFYITDNLGVTHISPNQTNNITLVAYDPKGNKTHLNFVLRISNGAMGEEYEPSKTNYLFPEDSLIQNGANWVVQTPSNTVYEPTKIVHSSNAHFCDASVEMHKAVAIKLKLENPTLPIEKYYVSVGSRALKTTYENGWLIAESKYAGAYSIKTDTQAPTIKGTSYNSSYIVKGSIVKLTITETQTELESYDLYIDGKWHLLEYEHKQDMLFFERPASLIGAHAVKIIAKDSCGNEVIYDRTLDFQ